MYNLQSIFPACIYHAFLIYIYLGFHTQRGCLPHRSLTSARSRPLRRPRVAPTLLPVRATNPLRPRFTLSPYLIPLNPQLPPWLLTEHDSLRTALVINNSPALTSSASPAAGHHTSPFTGACVKPRRVFTPRLFVYFILLGV